MSLTDSHKFLMKWSIISIAGVHTAKHLLPFTEMWLLNHSDLDLTSSLQRYIWDWEQLAACVNCFFPSIGVIHACKHMRLGLMLKKMLRQKFWLKFAPKMIKLAPKVQETANQQFNLRHFIHRKALNTLLYLTWFQHEIPKKVTMIRVF